MKEEYYIKGKEKYETLSEEVGNMKSEVEIKQKELKELKELKEKEEKIEREVYLYFIKYNFKIQEKARRINEFKIEEKQEDLYKKLDINSLSSEQLKQILYNITLQYRCQEDIIKISHQLQHKENEPINEIDLSEYEPPSDYTSEEANNARNKYNDKNDEVKEILDNYNSKLKEIEVIEENKDDYALLGIVDECISENVDKYKYEICFMKTIKQDSVLMGNYDHRENNNIYYYLHGEKCWNGPERSVKVEVVCGIENKILNVAEPSTCIYEMKFQTPVICPTYHKKLNFDPLSIDESNGEL